MDFLVRTWCFLFDVFLVVVVVGRCVRVLDRGWDEMENVSIRKGKK